MWWKKKLDDAPDTPPEAGRDYGSLRQAVEALGARLDAHESFLDGIQARIDELRSVQRDQALAIDEGIQRTERSEARVRAVVQRAKERMERAGYYDPSVDVEAEDLREEHARERPTEGVPPVPSDVAPTRDMSVFPGDWS